MDQQVLKAEVRKEVGRKVKKLRKEGILPANVYGKKIKSLAIQVNLKNFDGVYKKIGETGLLNLVVEGGREKKEEKPVLVSNVQKDPVSDLPIHVDFHQVDLKEKVEADVPVELTGESPVERQGIGTVVQYIDEVAVEALPTDLPDKFIIDTSLLIEVDQAFYVKDLKVDKARVDVKVDADTILVKVEPPQKVEEVVTPSVPVEGEAVAEGEGVPVEEKETKVQEEEVESVTQEKTPNEKAKE